VERAFWDEPRVLTISVHESGRYLFPGTGFPEDTGGPGAEGHAVNLALPPGTADAAWLRAFHAVVPPLVAEFQPQVLVTQQGCDSHVLDPLAHLGLTVDAQRTSYAALHDLAHRHAGGRWLATGGGGYELAEVVPRAWTHLLAEAAGAPIAPETAVPEGWREYVVERYGLAAPARMTDGGTTTWRDWSEGYDPADALDRAVLATQRAVFPANGSAGCSTCERAGPGCAARPPRRQPDRRRRSPRPARTTCSSTACSPPGCPKAMFGLEPTGRWNLEDILALMAERVGVSPDPRTCAARTGSTRTSRSTRWTGWPSTWPVAGAGRSRVLLATGHPAGLMVVHQAVAAALGTAGATVLTPADGFA
jgi:hypothetical protein